MHTIKRKYNNLSSAVRASLLFVFCGIVQKGISFATVPIYTRIMPANDYGKYSVYISWCQLLMIFTTLNMWNYLMNNGMVEFSDDKENFIASLQGLSTILTLVWLVIYLPFSGVWKEWSGLSLPVMLLLFLELLTIPSFEYWCSSQRFQYKAKGVVILTIIQAILMPIVTIPLVLNSSDKGFAAILGRALSHSFVYGMGVFFVVRKSRKWINFRYWKYALRFNVPLIPHFLSMIILQQSDRIMIERICGESDVAMYSVAYQASSALLVINQAILSVLVPYIYKAMEVKKDQDIKKRIFPLLLLIGIVNFLASALAPEIIAILAPIEYYRAAYVIPPVMLSNLFMFLFNLFATVEYYYKQTLYVAYASIISAIVNVLLNYVFVARYGFVAAGYTTLICYFIFSLFHYYFMKKSLNKFRGGVHIYEVDKLWITVILFCVATMLVIPFYRGYYSFVRYIMVVGIGIVAYFKRERIIEIIHNSIR